MLLVILCFIESFGLFWIHQYFIRLKSQITHNAASSLLGCEVCILRFGEVLPFYSVDPLMFGYWWTDILRCAQAQVKDLAGTLIHRAVAKPVFCGQGYLFRLNF